MMAQALVIIDVQQGMFAFPEMQPFDGDGTVARIRMVLDKARAEQAPIFFVQHDAEEGHPLAKGSTGFPFHSSLAPLLSEPVVEKRHCNSFQKTDLAAQLEAAGIKTLTVCGMQTQYCIDTFVRAAVERGFEVNLIADGHTTFDTPVLKAEQMIAHHNATLGNGFATLINADEVEYGSKICAAD